MFALITARRTSKDEWRKNSIKDILNCIGVYRIDSIHVFNLHVFFVDFGFALQMVCWKLMKKWCWYWDPLAEKAGLWEQSKPKVKPSVNRFFHRIGQPHSTAATPVVPEILLAPTSQNPEGASPTGDFNDTLSNICILHTLSAQWNWATFWFLYKTINYLRSPRMNVLPQFLLLYVYTTTNRFMPILDLAVLEIFLTSR